MALPTVTSHPHAAEVRDEDRGPRPGSRGATGVGRALDTGISSIQEDHGATVWGRAVATVASGLTADHTGVASGGVAGGRGGSGFGDVKYAIVSGKTMQEVQGRWASFVSGLDEGVDVNELVQQVLRESYLQTTEDLKFYAEKVKFYNELKKGIREELKRARDAMSTYAKLADGDTIPPFYEQEIDATFYGVSTAQHDAISNTDGQAPSGSGLHPWDGSHPPLDPAPASGAGVFVTGDGYAVSFQMTDYGGTAYGEVQMYGTDGKKLARLWGDPHVDAQQQWSFGQSSTFVLPDGTKISLNCKEVSPGVYKIDGVDLLSGTQHAALGTSPEGETGTGRITDDRVRWDAAHADATGDASSGVFVVQTDGKVLKSLGDGRLQQVAAQDWATYQRTHTVTTAGDEIAAADTLKAALQEGAQPAEGAKTANTKGQLDAYIKDLEDELNTVGDDAQLANVDLQNILQKQQQTLQMMSNISKMLNDTALAIIRKIG